MRRWGARFRWSCSRGNLGSKWSHLEQEHWSPTLQPGLVEKKCSLPESATCPPPSCLPITSWRNKKNGSGGAVRMEQRSKGSSLAVWFLVNFQFMLVFQTPAYQLLIKLHFKRAKHSHHLIEHARGTVGEQFRFLHPYLQVPLKGSRIISSLQVFLWPLCKQIEFHSALNSKLLPQQLQSKSLGVNCPVVSLERMLSCSHKLY